MNLLRRFIPNLAENLRELKNMLKKYNDVKWSEDAGNYFNSVKFSLTTAHVLISPYYSIDFIIFSFASEHTMATVIRGILRSKMGLLRKMYNQNSLYENQSHFRG